MKIRPVGAELFHSYGSTKGKDRRTDMKLIVSFAILQTRLKRTQNF